MLYKYADNSIFNELFYPIQNLITDCESSLFRYFRVYRIITFLASVSDKFLILFPDRISFDILNEPGWGCSFTGYQC